MRRTTKAKLPANRRVLRETEVRERTGFGATALHDAVLRREFPKPIKLTNSGRAIGWLEAEIDEWLKQRLQQRDKAASQ
jgi:prophage regulatory protein